MLRYGQAKRWDNVSGRGHNSWEGLEEQREDQCVQGELREGEDWLGVKFKECAETSNIRSVARL